MGANVLTLTSDVKEQGLRTYAQCHSELGGRATLLLINVSPTVTFSATVEQTMASAGMEVYQLSVGDGTQPRWNGLDSQHIKLNGELLRASPQQLLPTIVPRNTTDPTLLSEPLTITFVGVRGAAQCQ